MRTCTKCNQDLPIELFNVKDSRRGKRHSRCRYCMREYSRQHYLRNRSYYIAKNKRPVSKQAMWNLFALCSLRTDLLVKDRSMVYDKQDWGWTEITSTFKS